MGDLVMRRWSNTPCWTEAGEWWDRQSGESFRRDPATPIQLPKAEHLCPDVDASELPPEAPARGVRVGTPAPFPVSAPTPAKPATSVAKPTTVVAAVLRAAAKLTVKNGAITVRSVCSTSCGGRIIASSRTTHATVASATVKTAGGTRTHHLRLTAAGKRLVARSRAGLAIDLRWDAPGTATDAAGPRTRITSTRR